MGTGAKSGGSLIGATDLLGGKGHASFSTTPTTDNAQVRRLGRFEEVRLQQRLVIIEPLLLLLLFFLQRTVSGQRVII